MSTVEFTHPWEVFSDDELRRSIAFLNSQPIPAGSLAAQERAGAVRELQARRNVYTIHSK